MDAWIQRRTYIHILAGTFLLSGLTPTAQAGSTEPDARYVELIEKANRLLQKHKFERSFKAFEEANRIVGGDSVFAWVGQSVALNNAGDHERAYEHAREAVGLARDPALAAEARTEMAYAIALGSLDDPEALAEAIAGIRQYLAAAETDGQTNAVRLRLCEARRALDWAYPPEGSPVEFDGEDESLVMPRKLLVPQPSPTVDERRHLVRSQKAEIRTLVDADGCVASVETVEVTSDLWADITLRAISGWVFEPARRDGQPVNAYYSLSTHFNWSKSSRDFSKLPD